MSHAEVWMTAAVPRFAGSQFSRLLRWRTGRCEGRRQGYSRYVKFEELRGEACVGAAGGAWVVLLKDQRSGRRVERT
jgi:hypothetical protein